MFEGWASELLASYLGQFLEVQREQLRISLWSAWRTGLTLENVALRPDAFDHMQLPFKLVRGRVGSIQALVPWKALRSPLIINFSDVEIHLQLLGPEDMTPEVVAERALAAKQAHIAAQELQELAARVSPDGSTAKPAEKEKNGGSGEGKSGGLLWSLLQHALTTFMRRLQLSLKNVHISIEDPATGRKFGFRLGQLHTCMPGEVQHPSMLLAEDAGAEHASRAARGSIQKQLAAEGLQVYWMMVREGSAGVEDDREDAWSVLQPTDIVVHVSSKIIGFSAADPICCHVAAVVHEARLALRPCQVADVLHCADQLAWLGAASKHAHLRPPTVKQRGEEEERSAHRRAMWRFAINAVLAELRGPLKAAPWRSADAVQHARCQYVLLYRKRLELEREQSQQQQQQQQNGSGGGGSSSSGSAAASPADAAAGSGQCPSLSPARPPVLSPVGEARLKELERTLSVLDVVSCRSTARHCVEGSQLLAAGVASIESSSQPQRGVMWGLAKAGSFIGFHSRTALMLQPTESEVQELYKAVDFRPEEEEAEKAAAEARPGSAGLSLHLSFGIMFSAIDVGLLRDSGERAAAVQLRGLQVETTAGPEGATAGVTLANIHAQDCVSCGAGVEVQLLGRGPSESTSSGDGGGGDLGRSAAPPPVLRMQFAAKTSTLDVLVQPLRFQATPSALHTMALFVPLAVEGSFSGACMAAVNGLSDAARAVIKADHLRQLGPPLDMVAKVEGLGIMLTGENAAEGALLSTGALLVHTVGQRESVDAAERAFKVLGAWRDAGEAGAPATQALSGAAAAVEQQLVYQHLNVSVAGIELCTVPSDIPFLQLPALEPGLPASAPLLVPPAGRNPVLSPVGLSGSLKVHRLVEDFGAPQMCLDLSIDPIAVSLTPAVVATLGAALGLGPSTAAPPQETPSPSPEGAGSAASVAAAAAAVVPAGPALAVVDLRLAGVAMEYAASEDALACLIIDSGRIGVTTHALAVAVSAELSGVEIIDSTAEEDEAPAVHGFAFPRVAKRVSLESLGVSVVPPLTVDGAETLDVRLSDLRLEGYEAEAGNYICRTDTRQPADVAVSIASRPDAQHTVVALENVSMGHSTLLRIVTLLQQPAAAGGNAAAAEPPLPPSAEPQSPAPPQPVKAQTFSVEVNDARLAFKYNPSAVRGFHMPGALHDFLLAHGDVATLDLPRLSLTLPLLEATPQPGAGLFGGASNEQASASPGSVRKDALIFVTDATLAVATTGYPGRTSLPVLQLPLLEFTRENGDAQMLTLFAPSLGLGLHPSHFVTGAMAVMLCQQELAALAGRGAASTEETHSEAESSIAGGHPAVAAIVPPTEAPEAATLALPLTPVPSAAMPTRPPSPHPPPATASQPAWRLDARLGVLEVSVLGSTPSSTRLKAEWHGLAAVCSSSHECAVAPPRIAARLTWDHLSLHVLQPKEAAEALELTPYNVGALHSTPSSDSLHIWQLPPSFSPDLNGGAAGSSARPLRRSLAAGLGLSGAVAADKTPLGESPRPSSFSEARPYMLARFSASSAVSKYFSVAGSEFEDAASETLPDGSSRSPPDGHSPRSAPLLPLNVSGSDVDAFLLVRLASTLETPPEHYPCTSDRAPANVALSWQAPRLDSMLESLSLRVFLHGWHHAAECVYTYQIFAHRAKSHLKAAHGSGMLGAMLSPTAAAAPAAPPPPPAQPRAAAPERVSTPASPVNAPQASRLDLSLDARAISVEAVATGERLLEDAERLVPVGRLDLTLAAQFECGPSGARVMVAAPALSLAVGAATTADAKGPERLHFGPKDALLGVNGAVVTASDETFVFDSHAELMGAPVLTVKPLIALAGALQQASVWANPRNLSAAIALAQHAAHMAADLQLEAPPSHDRSAAHGGAPGGGHDAELPPPHFVTSVEVGCIAVLLQSDQQEEGVPSPPLLEFAASDIDVQVKDEGSGELSASATMRLCLDVFNSAKLAWEPVIEPWQLAVSVTLPLFRGGAAADGALGGHHYHQQQHAPLHHFPRHLYVEAKSEQSLELTVSAPATDAAAAAMAMADHVGEVAREPDTFFRRFDPGFGGSSSPLSARFQLVNLTGSDVEVWLAAPLPGGARPLQPPADPPELQIPSSGRVSLPVLSFEGLQARGLHSGRPDAELGVALDGEGAAQRAAGRSEAEAGPRATRTLLYFRLAEQKGRSVAGPVHLDLSETSEHSVQVSSSSDHVSQLTGPTALRVVAVTSELGHSSFTCTLHSGVQIRNTTHVELEVGVQTTVGLSLGVPHSLGVLAPGDSSWLPTSRGSIGMLCMRPSHSYCLDRPGRLPPLPGGGKGGQPEFGGRAHSGVVYRSTAYRQGAHRGGSADGVAAGPSHAFGWSVGIPLAQLLSGVASSRQVACKPTFDDSASFLVAIGATQQGSEWEVTVAPPLTLHNALPLPVDVTLFPRWDTPTRLRLLPNERAPLQHLDIARIETMALRAEGFEPTTQFRIHVAPPLGAPTQPDLHLRSHAASAVSSSHTPSEEFTFWGAAAGGDATTTTTTLREMAPGCSTVQVSVHHSLVAATGAHSLRLSCGLWVYNCSGVPLSLRPAPDEALSLSGQSPDDLLLENTYDDVPDSWIPPLLLPGHEGTLGPLGMMSPLAADIRTSPVKAASTPLPSNTAGEHPTPTVLLRGEGGGGGGRGGATPPPQRDAHHLPAHSTHSMTGSMSMLSVGRTASAVDMPGLSEILEGPASSNPRMAAASPLSPSRGSVLGMQRPATRARGIADSMDTAPTFERPSAWPSMASAPATGRAGSHRLRLQLRAAPSKAPPGRTFWSQLVDLEPSGGGTVASVPSPGPPAAATANAHASALRGSYPLIVTASPVPHADGVLALCIAPRFVLRNLLDVAILYRQQDAAGERELPPGGARAVRWTDAALPPRLCVRVQEAGWLWSGGFLVDTPGDLFVKVRHRDRGETMLVRVDVAATSTGAFHIVLSHNPAGFAPYRVENCSLETLHARQRSVREQQDVLRPYCSLNYAWDEPTQPHKLVLELPGAQALGTFDLDKVGQDVFVSVPSRRGEPDRKLRVIVQAEGPTRVLTVIDPERHPIPIKEAPSRLLQSSQLAAFLPAAPPPLTSFVWKVSVNLTAVGASLVGPTQEAAYVQLAGVEAVAAAGAARHSLSLVVRRIQLDNPSPWVAYPVTLVLPAPISTLGSSVAAAVEKMNPLPALSARLSVWQRRPAGVLCVEVAELKIPSVGLFLDQLHLEDVAVIAESVVAGLAKGSAPGNAIIGAGARATHSRGLLPASAPISSPSKVLDAGGTTAIASSSTTPTARRLLLQPGAAASEPRQPTLGDGGALPGMSVVDLTALSGPEASAGPSWHRQKVYIDHLSLSRLDVSLSFLSSPVHHFVAAHPRLAALQRLLSLADVEDAHLSLSGLQLSNPLMDAGALGQVLQRHYLRALVAELYKVVGAASMFGDPVTLVQSLGLGVWTFVAEPAAGLVESARALGPRQFVLGVLRGIQGLVRSVIFAVANATTKASGAARKAIVVWGLDRQDDEPLGAGDIRRRVMFLEGGRRGGDSEDAVLLSALLRGLAGLLSEPIRGAEEGGVAGLFRGLQRGVLGAVALPLAALLEMSARTADSIRRAVAGSSNLGWVRPPRHVSTAEALAPYDWSEAMGRWLLTELDRDEAGHRRGSHRSSGGGGFAGVAAAAAPPEAFVLCVPCAAAGSYLVLTSRRAVYVKAKGLMWEAQVLWQAAVADLELAAWDEGTATVRLVANPPLPKLQPWAHGQPLRSTAFSLFSFLCVECQSPEAASRVQDAARSVMAAAPRRWAVMASGAAGAPAGDAIIDSGRN